MVIQKTNFSILKIKQFWFSEHPPFNLVREYIQSKFSGRHIGFKQSSHYTKLIDLSEEINAIEKGISKTTKYKIRRAIREGVVFQIENSVSCIVSFYNEFAKSNAQLSAYKEIFIANNKDHLVVTKAVQEEETVAMHGYIVDKEVGRVRLLFSATKSRLNNSNAMNANIGRANRFLHFKDMLYFKEKGFSVYDFGGYAKGTTDRTLLGINTFKDTFGGVLVEEFNYTPFWMFGLRQLKQVVLKMVKH